MPAPIRIRLSASEERTLGELRTAQCVPQRVRDRAHIILLNARGRNAPDLAEIFECRQDTVRGTLKRWQQGGLGGLWDAKGRGRKASYTAADWACVEQWLTEDERTYNSTQLAHRLQEERDVKLSSAHVRRLLKKKIPMEADSSESSPQARRGF